MDLSPHLVRQNEKHQTLELCFDSVIHPTAEDAPAVLHFQYTALVRDNFRGIYECDFVDERNGLKYVGVVTHFEPTDARCAFPCFDEPARRAIFELELVVPQEFDAISNTFVRTVELLQNGMKRICFHRTPAMSCYLLSFVVGKMDHVQREVILYDGRRVLVRAWTPLGRTQEARFSLDVACKAVAFYSEKFRISYMLDKLDLCSVPMLDALAMENWGLCIFRERYFLVDRHTSLALKQRIARLLAHEISHQWVGNFVSINWWKYLWLKEGFARYLEYVFVTHHFPSWQYWCHFEREIRCGALEMDEDTYTHPVEVECYHSSQIHAIFDSISYGKGACVLRMISVYLGNRLMWKGLRHFLQKHCYNSATTEDLWQAFHEVTGVDIKLVMDCWVKSSCHPVLQLSFERGGDDTHYDVIHVEQRLMFRNMDAEALKHARIDEQDKKFSRYIVPLIIKQYSPGLVGTTPSTPSTPVIAGEDGNGHGRTDGEKTNMTVFLEQSDNLIHFLLDTTHARIQVPRLPHSWFKFNWGSAGFYRVNYPREMWLSLAGAIERNEMPPEDQLGLLMDACAFARQPNGDTGRIDMDVFMNLLLAFKNHKNHHIWHYITEQVEWLLLVLWQERTEQENAWSGALPLFISELFSVIASSFPSFNDFLPFVSVEEEGFMAKRTRPVPNIIAVEQEMDDDDDDNMDDDVQWEEGISTNRHNHNDMEDHQEGVWSLKSRIVSMMTSYGDRHTISMCWNTFKKLFYLNIDDENDLMESSEEEEDIERNEVNTDSMQVDIPHRGMGMGSKDVNDLVDDETLERVERDVLDRIPAEMLEVVLGVCVQKGSPAVHRIVRRLLHVAMEKHNKTLRHICLVAMWYSENSYCILTNLEMIYNSSFAISEDEIFALRNVLSRNTTARGVLWNDLLLVAFDDIHHVLSTSHQISNYEQFREERLSMYLSQSTPTDIARMQAVSDTIRTTQHSAFFNLLIVMISSLKSHCANRSFFNDVLRGSRLLEPLVNARALRALFDGLSSNVEWLDTVTPSIRAFLRSRYARHKRISQLKLQRNLTRNRRMQNSGSSINMN